MPRLRAWIPDEQSLSNRAGLRWLGPLLRRPWLWQFTRRRVALGAGIGVFFGFLIPVAQLVGAALLAVVLRANLPIAAVATLVSNPLTYAPIGIGAYRTGLALLDEEAQPLAEQVIADAAESEVEDMADTGWWERLRNVGKPLLLGMAVFAVVGGVLTWMLVHAGWIATVWWRRRKRVAGQGEGR